MQDWTTQLHWTTSRLRQRARELPLCNVDVTATADDNDNADDANNYNKH